MFIKVISFIQLRSLKDLLLEITFEGHQNLNQKLMLALITEISGRKDGARFQSWKNGVIFHLQ